MRLDALVVAQRAHHDVCDHGLAVLADLHVVDREVDGDVHEPLELASVESTDGEADGADLVGVADAPQDILGVARAGDGDHHVVGSQPSLEAVREDVFVAEVVGGGGGTSAAETGAASWLSFAALTVSSPESLQAS